MTEPLKVFFFGDSICFGQGVSLHRGWVTRISGELDALAAEVGREVMVVNASINGNTTRLALERMPYDVQSQGPGVILAQFGMNDCNYWLSDGGVPRVSREAFRANLHEIVARGLAFGARRVLLNTNHPTTRDGEPVPHAGVTFEDSNRLYNETIREVAAAHDPALVGLNDVERAFLDATGGRRDELAELLLPDRLHPSERGHGVYFEAVYPSVRCSVLEALDLA